MTDSPNYSRSYTHYVLGTLVVVFIFNYIDRQILAILAQPIKMELGLSDTQLGILSGVAFGLFYATLGIPIARLADRRSRVNIISIALTVWSLMTALSGLALSYWHLLLTRIGVGIGEAGCVPPSHSIIADYFKPSRRATAFGIYSLGIPIGVLFGNLLGGWLNEYYGWRIAFMAVGLPGILLAVVVRMTIKEPPRGYSEPEKVNAAEERQVPFTQVIKTMWGFKSFRYLTLGTASSAFVVYALIAWMPSFFIRSHGMTTGEVGTALGLMFGICGGLGTFLGGYLGDRYGTKDKRVYMRIPAFAFLVATPFMLFTFMAESQYASLTFYAIPAFLTTLYTGPTLGMAMSLAPLAMRASVSALILFVINFVGLLFGPTSVGLLSDLFQDTSTMTSEDALKVALMVCSLVYLLSASGYFIASRHIRDDLAKKERLYY